MEDTLGCLPHTSDSIACLPEEAIFITHDGRGDRLWDEQGPTLWSWTRLIELENIPSYATQNDADNGKATTPADYLHVLGCIEDLDSRDFLIQWGDDMVFSFGGHPDAASFHHDIGGGRASRAAGKRGHRRWRGDGGARAPQG